MPALVVAVVLLQAALEGRSSMAVPAVTVFQSMLRFAEQGEAEKVERSLALLGPLLAEHGRILGTTASDSLSRALASGDRSVLEAAVSSLVARDIVVLLRGVEDAAPGRARTLLRTASLEWALLDGEASHRDGREAQAVSALLRDVAAAVEDGELAEAAALVRRIELALTALFPPP